MGSGMGKTSTRGHKGQRSRSGSRMMRGFEGGQMPLHRRLPKRGFNNIFRTEYSVVNLDRIAELGEKDVTPETLHKAGIIHSASALVKILGDGELKKGINIHAHKFSKSAQEKIAKAGGKATVIGGEETAAPAAKPAKPQAKAKTEAKSESKPERSEKKPEAKKEKE